MIVALVRAERLLHCGLLCRWSRKRLREPIGSIVIEQISRFKRVGLEQTESGSFLECDHLSLVQVGRFVRVAVIQRKMSDGSSEPEAATNPERSIRNEGRKTSFGLLLQMARRTQKPEARHSSAVTCYTPSASAMSARERREKLTLL
jgi:hypothetical protein